MRRDDIDHYALWLILTYPHSKISANQFLKSMQFFSPYRKVINITLPIYYTKTINIK
jgi:hypothetical protein